MSIKKKLFELAFLFVISILVLANGEKSNITNITGAPSSQVTSLSQQVADSLCNLEEITRSEEFTLMVYMCGSNLESRGAAATADILEMALSGFSCQKVNVVLLAGGSYKWWIPQISAETAGIYQVGNGGLRFLQNLDGSNNMGDPETLQSFLSVTYKMFPSDKYALIIWDHGGGLMGGICNDECNNDYLDSQRITPRQGPGQKYTANKDFTYNKGSKVVVIASENGYYLVESQEWNPNEGKYQILRCWVPTSTVNMD